MNDFVSAIAQIFPKSIPLKMVKSDLFLIICHSPSTILLIFQSRFSHT